MIALISGSVLKIIINWCIIAIPKINIYGAPVGTLLGYFFMAALNYYFIRYGLNERPNLRRAFVKPLVCSLIMGATAFAVYHVMQLILGGYSGMLVSLAAAILVAVIIYVIAVVKSRSITAEDMHLIPGGAKVARILHIQ